MWPPTARQFQCLGVPFINTVVAGVVVSQSTRYIAL
jgi:hypothetical protein